MEPIGIGVIGAGAHGVRAHITPLESIEGATVVAVSDPNVEALNDCLEHMGDDVTGYSDTDLQILRDDRVDALIVCSPDQFHTETLYNCMLASKHVLVEKPLADNIADMDPEQGVPMYLRMAAESSLVVSSCHPRRFDPPFLWAKEHLPQWIEQLGEAQIFAFDFFYHQPSKQGLHTGMLSDHLNHEIDLMHWLFGHETFTAHRLYDSQTRYGVAGVRTDGLSFTFFGSRDLNAKIYGEQMRIRFARGEVTINTHSGVATVADWDTQTERVIACGATDYIERFRGINQDFIDAIRNGQPPYLSHSDLLVDTTAGVQLHEHGVYTYEV